MKKDIKSNVQSIYGLLVHHSKKKKKKKKKKITHKHTISD